jgi:ferredoxin
MTENNISEAKIREVFDEIAQLLPGTKYVVCDLGDELDFTGHFQKQGYNYAVLFYFPLEGNVWDGYTEVRMATLQTRCFPNAARLGEYAQRLCDEAGIPLQRPPIGKDHMTPPYITPLSAKEVGVKGGAGWIGKSDLLVTFEYGPKVTTVAAVFYADNFTVGEPVTENRCGNCHRCVDACPWHNIRGNAWHAGVERDDLVDYHGCSVSRYLASGDKSVDIPSVGKKVACCRCMMACPIGVKNVQAVIDSQNQTA